MDLGNCAATQPTMKVGQRRTDFHNFDPYAAPKDYEALWTDYYDRARKMCVKLGIRPSEADDATCEILCRFMERDFLPKFDPTVTRRHRGVVYRTSFAKWFDTFVETYVRGIRDKHRRLATREKLICDASTPVGGELWVEVHGPKTIDDPTETLWASEVVARVREELALIPPRDANDPRDLVRVFDMTMEQVSCGVTEKARREDGKWVVEPCEPTSVWRPDRKLIAAAFDVSDSAVGSWLADLKLCVAEALVKIDPVGYARFAVGT